MGCEPRGFGWSATVEVCSARVTRLVTDQEKSKKISGHSTGAWHRARGLRLRQVPGTGLGSGDWTGFTSIPTRDRKGAWHREVLGPPIASI